MPPYQGDVINPFDAWEFKKLVNKDVPEDMIKKLQQECGDDITGAVDQYHALEKEKKSARDSKVEANVQKTKEDKESRGIRERDQYWDKSQRRWRLKAPARTSITTNSSRFVLFVRRVYSERMIVERTVVQVNGQVLRNALRNIFRESEGFTLTKDQGVEHKFNVRMLTQPFAQLEDIRFMYWAKPELELLRKHYQSQEDAISLFEIEAGLTFIQTEWAHTHAAVESLLPSSIRFDYLWTIFTPDSLLVGKDALGSRTIWRVRSGNQLKTEKGYAFAITTEHVEWNGERMDMVKRVVKIDQFFGTIALEDLPVMPLRYHPQALLIVEKILERSDKKMVFCEKGHQFRDHNGLCLTAGFSRADEPVLHHYSGRIMVDLEMMHQVEPNNVLLPSLVKFRIPRVFMSDVTSDEQEILSHLLRDPNKLEGFSTDNHSVNNESEMLVAEKGKEEGTLKRSMIMERRLLLSGMLFGYFLSDAKWGAFSIDRVSEIKWNETGKGKGLVGLLQGPPGSGKTLTAEAIAETAKMPLYTISSGALGTGPVEIHKSLVKILHLAAHWKAVLLLDEADVFLTKSTMADVSRNAIVSIFLSELEYYQGILLLTTNKAQDIDEAFKSRIHFCHSYPNLDFAARKTIWQDFMKRTQETQTGVSVDVTDDGIEKLAEMPLNGRQIKNAMSIAVSLAFKDDLSRIIAQDIIETTEALQIFSFESSQTVSSTPTGTESSSGSHCAFLVTKKRSGPPVPPKKPR
ncbi:hypothetical protein HDK64DRAFT_329212 [Phyllosticta capitalensis]